MMGYNPPPLTNKIIEAKIMHISSYYSHKLKKNLLMIFPLMALPMFFPAEVKSQTPEERGLEIAIEAEKRESGFGDFTS